MALTIKHRVTLDLSLTSVQATVPFRRGDTAAHEVIFNLRNGTTNVELPVGSVATIAVLNGADEGKGVVDMCTVDHINHRIIYIPTVAALSVAGNVACELTVVGTNGEVLGAPRIHFFVDESMTDVTEEEIAEALKASGSWDVIQKTAENANAAAQSKEDAETAQGKAETAQGAAVAAKTAAEAAQGKAETAQGKAETAQGKAETAQGKAEAAKTAAETAQGKAEAAKTAAETAQGKAETAKTAAETAKTAAETAQAAAVTARYEANTSANRASGSAQTASEHATAAVAAKTAAVAAQASAQEAEAKAQEYAEKIGEGAANFRASINNQTYVLTLELLDASGAVMSVATIDLPLESSITNIAYDEAYKDLIFTLRNSNTTRVPLDAIVSGLATEAALNAGLAGKVDKLTAALKLYGTDSNGKQTSYSIVGVTGNSALAIMTQAAVTAALKEISTSIKTNEDNIAKNAEDIASNAERITALEQNGGGNVEVVQTIGDSNTAVMSQGATTKELRAITRFMRLKATDNICDPNTLEPGFVNNSTGVIGTNTDYRRTPNIPVQAGDVIKFYYNAQNGIEISPMQARFIAVYDSEGELLSNLGATYATSYTVPNGVASFIASFYTSYTLNGASPVILKNYEGTPTSPILYEYGYVATEQFLDGLTFGASMLSADVVSRLNDPEVSTPDYITQEVERVNRATLNEHGVLNFIFSTDQHLASNLSNLYRMQEIADVAKTGRFDFCCLGGDMIQSGDTSWYRATDSSGNVTVDNGWRDKKEIVIDHLTQIANAFKDVQIPVYFCQGNHDVCFGAYHDTRDYNAYYGYSEGDANYKDPDAQSLLPREFFRLMNNRLGETVVWDGENPNGGYFYKDFDRAKIRAIFLQTQDVFNDDGTVVDTVNNTSLNPRIQQKQFAWFCNKALNFMDKGEDRTNWAVIILSHVNVTLGAISGGSISNNQCELIRGVLDAFMKGGTYTASTPAGDTFPLSANVDFTEQGVVDFICSINGHVHADFAIDIGYAIEHYTNYDEHFINRPAIQVCCASTAERDYSGSALKDYFTVPDREEGTISAECFDIFSIDRSNRKIKTIRFGAGTNREIDY